MTRILKLTMGGETREIADPTGITVDEIDLYSFDDTDLGAYSGMIISGGCDQIFLERRRTAFSDWVRAGGRLLINGHPLRQFVDGLPSIRKMEFHGLRDVWLSAVDEHPVWDGIDRRDVLLRTGVPGDHTFEELTSIGVAGFYARNYLANLPEGASVITGIGPNKLPVDVAYSLGEGEVIVHAGNDLMSFDSTNLQPQILSHLGSGRCPQGENR